MLERASQAPTILSVKIINVTSTGFTVDIVASSTPRNLTSASLTFTAAASSQLNGTTFPNIPVSAPATTWFSSQAGRDNGGAFDLQIPFNYSGDTSAIGSVAVTLSNVANGSAATSASVSGGI